MKTHSNNLSRARPCSIKAFILLFYPRRHSREEMYQALSALPYYKRWEAGRGPGNEATQLLFQGGVYSKK